MKGKLLGAWANTHFHNKPVLKGGKRKGKGQTDATNSKPANEEAVRAKGKRSCNNKPARKELVARARGKHRLRIARLQGTRSQGEGHTQIQNKPACTGRSCWGKGTSTD